MARRATIKKKTNRSSSRLASGRFSARQLLLFMFAFVIVGAAVVLYAFADTGTTNDLALTDKGSLKKFRNGTLVEPVGKDPVYVITNENGTYEKRLIGSRAIMNALGYTWEQDVLYIPESQLPVKDGVRITADRHPNGTAIKSPVNDTIWLINGDKRVKFASYQIFQSYGYRALPATASDMKLEERKNTITQFREGALLRVNEPTSSLYKNVYTIERHGNTWPTPATYRKRQLSQVAFVGLGYKDNEPINITAAMLPADTGPPILTANTSHPLGTIIRLPNDQRYWLINKNGRVAFADVNFVKSYGYNAATAKNATPNPDLQWILSDQYKRTYGDLGYSASATGAVGINAKWEAGQSNVWYVSQQEEGADAIAKGIAFNNPALIDLGIKMFDWGFNHQQPNGSFEPQYDIPASQTISYNFFVTAVAHSCLLLQQSDFASQYSDKCGTYKPKLQQAITWIGAEPQWSSWIRHITNQTGYGTFLHQEYEYAAAVGLVYKFTGDYRYMSTAYGRIESANSRQDPAGWNMEINGYDTGYGSLGLRAATYWVSYLPDDPMTPGLRTMLDKAMPWYASRVEANGHVNSSGNTRTCVYRGGDQGKDPGYSTLVWDFGYWGVTQNKSVFVSKSTNVMDYLNLVRQGKAQRCP